MTPHTGAERLATAVAYGCADYGKNVGCECLSCRAAVGLRTLAAECETQRQVSAEKRAPGGYVSVASLNRLAAARAATDTLKLLGAQP